MKPNTQEGPICVLCDIWWIILLVILLALATFLTRDYWMPLVGLDTPAPSPLPTLAIPPVAQPSSTPIPQATSLPIMTTTPIAQVATITPGVPLTAAPVQGGLAPNFTLPDANGNVVELNSLRGKPVLLIFMGSDCPYCKQEAAFLETIHKQYADQGLQVVVIGTEVVGIPTQIAGFPQTFTWSFSPLVDDGSVSPDYNLTGVPDNYFIDRNGVIKYIGVGYMDEQQIISQISKIL